MKKKPFVLGLVAVAIAYLAGAYYLYRKLLFPILSSREVLTYIWVVASGFLLFITFSLYYILAFQRQLKEQKVRQRKSSSKLQ
jgi:membrane protein implicated in regulation of membrane protease activity